VRSTNEVEYALHYLLLDHAWGNTKTLSKTLTKTGVANSWTAQAVHEKSGTQ
jgi:hypothetical protein